MALHARNPVAAVSVLLVLGLLAIVVNHENGRSMPIEREESVPAISGLSETSELKKAKTAEADWNKRVDNINAAKVLLRHRSNEASREQKKSANHLLENQKKAVEMQHQSNKAARAALRKAAKTAATNQVRDVVTTMGSKLKKLAKAAAKNAAARISKATQFSRANKAAEKKMKLLERDVELLLAAKKKVSADEAASSQGYKKKAQAYKELVHKKMRRATKDLKAIQSKLVGYKVALNTKKLVGIEKHKIAKKLVQEHERLKWKTRDVNTLKVDLKKALKRGKKRVTRTKKKLKRLSKKLVHKLKKKKTQLDALQHSPDISVAMAKQIGTQRKKIARLRQQLREDTAYSKHLKAQLKEETHNTQELQLAARKRKRVLGIANNAYTKLVGVVHKLNKMVAEQKRRREYQIKAPKHSDASTARKVKRAIQDAVRRAAKDFAPGLKADISNAASKAAAHQAEKSDTEKIKRELKKHTARRREVFSEDPLETAEVSADVPGQRRTGKGSEADPSLMRAATKLLRKTRRKIDQAMTRGT